MGAHRLGAYNLGTKANDSESDRPNTGGLQWWSKVWGLPSGNSNYRFWIWSADLLCLQRGPTVAAYGLGTEKTDFRFGPHSLVPTVGAYCLASLRVLELKLPILDLGPHSPVLTVGDYRGGS